MLHICIFVSLHVYNCIYICPLSVYLFIYLSSVVQSNLSGYLFKYIDANTHGYSISNIEIPVCVRRLKHHTFPAVLHQGLLSSLLVRN